MHLFGVFGQIDNPFSSTKLNVSAYTGTSGEGLIVLFSNIVKLAIVAAGIYTLINLILSGYGYLSAGGDQKQVQKAHEGIWRSFLGLVIVTGSVLIAGVLGYILFGRENWSILISPKIYTP